MTSALRAAGARSSRKALATCVEPRQQRNGSTGGAPAGYGEEVPDPREHWSERREDLLVCRVCGLAYDEPPWGPELVYEYCDCCGVQFSYEDALPDGARAFREKWLAGGARWAKPERRPEPWDRESQLGQIPDEFR
jgi:hypothetical protein